MYYVCLCMEHAIFILYLNLISVSFHRKQSKVIKKQKKKTDNMAD